MFYLPLFTKVEIICQFGQRKMSHLLCSGLLLKRMKSRQKFGRPFFLRAPARPPPPLRASALCVLRSHPTALLSNPSRSRPNPPPTRHLLQSAPPLPATPLHAPPHSPLYPRHRRSAFLLYSPATLPPALLLSSPLYLCRCWSVFFLVRSQRRAARATAAVAPRRSDHCC
jgi:hypothetical protein